ncbi:Crp/Fnr family transcriptional regulator [Roseibacterium sp. SDUM158017]|uniref:Crp/Fnr family transcriptional regulator n=1 Tax=Roseicyclus salinarum TaxID=3036773 RepID=UPI002415645E|nr:Crp/Fnr family transcriptional regulator [Roseibacterium sp. SDUM158017]MDG4648450.1 Crp/Fnr family transcriptional regulator [Roseibacterium sp. SDUM158017]
MMGQGCTATRERVTRSGIFSELRPDTRDALMSMCLLRRFRAGQTVLQENEAADVVGLVVSGVLRMQKTLADGRQHIVGLLVEGDVFGRVFGGPTGYSVEAAVDAEYCSFARAPFESLLMRSPDLDRAVLLNVLDELDRAREWMVILSNQKIANRVAGFLNLMCARFSAVGDVLAPAGEGVEVRIPISRTDLSHLLGTRPESISRALHRLQDLGDIEILDPGRILVRDRQALAERAGEEECECVPDALGGMSRGLRAG